MTSDSTAGRASMCFTARAKVRSSRWKTGYFSDLPTSAEMVSKMAIVALRVPSFESTNVVSSEVLTARSPNFPSIGLDALEQVRH